MSRKKKWGTSLAVLLIGLLLGTLLLEPFTSSRVYAETVPITYDIPAADWNWNGLYIRHSSLTTNVGIGKDGYTIKSVRFEGNGQTFEVLGAEGQLTYTVRQTLPGVEVPIRSIDNATTQGYYAWFRQSKGSGEERWRANFNRIDDSYVEYGDYRYCASSVKDEFDMPAFPGCSDSNLTLSGPLQNGFYTKDSNDHWVELKAVDRSRAVGMVTKDVESFIPGPEGEGINGRMVASSVSNERLDFMSPDMSQLIVRYTKSFDFPSAHAKPLPAYGAALMVYFDAFIIDIDAYTYAYPYTLHVEYEPLVTDKPDLIASNIIAQSSLITNAPVTFQLEWTSSGPQATQPFVVEVNHLATNLYRKTIQPGDYTSGTPVRDTFTATFPTPGSKALTLNVDIGNAIEEASESNNDILRSFTVTTDPGITGDFDVIPTTIHYRDPVRLVPKNITESNGCTYSYHLFRLERTST